jgi:hypothetical protein
MRHVFVDRFHQRHELIFAELAVLILVEFREQLFWIWRLWSAAGVGSAAGALRTLGTTSGLRLLGIGLSPLFLASGAHLAHFLASFGALLVIELAVFIRVEFLEHLFAHFGALLGAFLAVLVGRLRDCRQRYDADGNQCETRDKISHFRSFQSCKTR